MRETHYVLEDDTTGDPRDVAPGPDGVLRHKNGKAVAYGPHGPRGRGVDVDEAQPEPETIGPEGDADVEDVVPQPKGRGMQAETTKGGYKTRGARGR